jgi:toxin ParE1/3/4
MQSMLKYNLHPEAVADIDSSIDYYDEERTGLGMEFYGEFQRTLGFLRRFPYAGIIHLNDIRRFSLDRFHHHIFYQYAADEIFVLAVIHHSRHQDSWKGRNPDKGNG